MKKVYESKSSLIVYLVLRFLVILVGVRSIFRHDYESLFLCVLTLSLLILPSFLERRLKVEIPSTFEIIILCFIFSAEILGEIHNFYIIVPHWDTILHTLNGFNCAAIGFALGESGGWRSRAASRWAGVGKVGAASRWAGRPALKGANRPL